MIWHSDGSVEGDNFKYNLLSEPFAVRNLALHFKGTDSAFCALKPILIAPIKIDEFVLTDDVEVKTNEDDIFFIIKNELGTAKNTIHKNGSKCIWKAHREINSIESDIWFEEVDGRFVVDLLSKYNLNEPAKIWLNELSFSVNWNMPNTPIGEVFCLNRGI